MWGNVGKENSKTLVESILRGFYVPGAGLLSLYWGALNVFVMP